MGKRNSSRRRTVKPWESQEGEGAKAFEAFQVYLELGGKRNVREVSARLGKSTTLIFRWSSLWHWVERAREYDSHNAEQARKQAVKDQKEQIKRHIQIARGLQSKALKALNLIDPSELTPRDITNILKFATELEASNRMLEIKDKEELTDGETPEL